jgi:Asp-tRNA(Asn)/Glu-tRNA(Gln) amidotransferase A subunit family amidase
VRRAVAQHERLGDPALLAQPVVGLPPQLGNRVGGEELPADPPFRGFLGDGLGAVFADFDVLLTPTLPTPPWPVMRFEGRSVVGASLGAGDIVTFVAPWNVTGQPAAAVPAGFTDDGLPLAVQLIGRSHDETTLLSLAAQLEAERPWADQRPALAV